ncbi:MAG: hypothetical protein R6V22_09190 [Rhodohalobacter sp.]|uniref:hypothetical protein n=1 Tax=Rhodohalobacter sp. TaxID=1974210 RepID=UPI0039761B51
MKKLTIHIEDDSYDNFLNVIKVLGYVTIAEHEEIPQWRQEEVQTLSSCCIALKEK